MTQTRQPSKATAIVNDWFKPNMVWITFYRTLTMTCVYNTQGIICHIRRSDDGTSWNKRIYVPRRLVLAYIRDPHVWYGECHPVYYVATEFISSAGSGCPGQHFASEPVIIRRTRRYYVIAQMGGLDV